MQARSIDHVNIRIPESGVEDALSFYRDALGFEPENLDAYREGERTLFSFRLADDCVLHVRPVESIEPPEKQNYDHFAIVVDESIDEVRTQLEEHGIDIERESTPLGATGRKPAVYVRDPFGYHLELKSRA